MTRHSRGAIALALATALGEAALQALVVTDWSNPGAHAMLFAFLVGPQLFLALLAWRRRAHERRSRVLFAVAALTAIGGLGALGFHLYCFNTDAAYRKEPSMIGLIVPLAQWVVMVAVWLWLVICEGAERRAARQAGQTANTSGV